MDTQVPVQENVSLKEYATFKTGGPARFFYEARSVPELIAVLKWAREAQLAGPPLPIFILGEGSNILVSDEGFPGLVIRIMLKGVSMVTTGNSIRITAAAGENWDAFVAHTVTQGYYGLENLSYIPGTVGAAPVQNIGAYGVEAKSVIESVTALDMRTLTLKTFTPAECHFSYRDSFFKKEEGKNFVITAVSFRLSKNGELSLGYKDIKEYYEQNPLHPVTLAGVRDAVVAIRTRKLPDWKKLGTAGSFFKNPIITFDHFGVLSKKYPGIPSFPGTTKNTVKVPLAWILDKVCGYRGLRKGNIGVYENQSLVLVNFGNGTTTEIKALADEMIKKVKDTTGVTIEPEVQYIG